MKPKTAGLLMLIGGVLVLGGAIWPLTRGGSVNFPLLVVAGALIVLAPVVAKKAGSSNNNPPAT